MSKEIESNLLVRGITVIEILAKNGPLSIENIFNESQIPRSSIYRILCTLESLGYVIRLQDKAKDIWKLDLKILNILSHILSRFDLKSELWDILNELAEESKEIVQLCILSKNKILVIDNIKRCNSIISVAPIGALLDINICASGLAIGAFISEDELDDILKTTELPKHTDYTITDPQELKKLLKRIKKQGYSFDNQYYAIGHRCIGAPVFDNTGNVIAAINISGHIKTISDDRINELAGIVMKSAEKATKRLGYVAK